MALKFMSIIELKYIYILLAIRRGLAKARREMTFPVAFGSIGSTLLMKLNADLWIKYNLPCYLEHFLEEVCKIYCC